MKSLKGTKTETNLLTAFIGESQTRNKYIYFAEIAWKEGYVKIANIFEETANHEKEHAKIIFNFLESKEIELKITSNIGIIGNTKDNLQIASNDENHANVIMYPDFAKIAKEEGFDKISIILSNIAISEKLHEERFKNLALKLKEASFFEKDKEEYWRCINCGYLHKGKSTPKICPACAHEQKYFEIFRSHLTKLVK